MSGHLKKLRSAFQPWMISVVAGILFALLVISLNCLLRGKSGFQFLEIDYSMHLFFTSSFTNFNNLDNIVVLGSSLVYWGVGGFLFLKASLRDNFKKPVRAQLSDISQIGAAGFLIYYQLLLCCCWLLAFYEGYIPMIFDNSYLNHGPWRLISHLKLLLGWSSMQIVISLIMSVLSSLIKFNREAIILFVIICLVFVFNVYSHMWLID